MGRGPVVQKQKELSAKSRGKAFTIHGKLIAIAAARGADPSENSALAEVIYKAKKDNVPNDNIDRAIKRWSGQEKGALAIEEVLYEGYGPGGVAVIVKALTDNRNRTAPNMRHIFSKCSGTLGETGSVSNFAFRFVGLITLAGALTAELEEILIESWASDYRAISEGIEVETEWSQFAQVKKYLTSKNIEIVSSGGEYVSTNSVELTDFDKALKVYTLVESLEEDEDVESVWHNSVIPESLSTQILEHVERNRFRT